MLPYSLWTIQTNSWRQISNRVNVLKGNKGIFGNEINPMKVTPNAGINTALLICFPVQHLLWQSFTRDSQETFKTFVARTYLPQKLVWLFFEMCADSCKPSKYVTPFTMLSALSGEQQCIWIFVYQLLVGLGWPAAISHLGPCAILCDECS